MRGRYRIGLVLAFVLQVGLLGWMIADRALLLRSGTELRLPVVPVDPRDIFRGDYVVLNYEASRMANTKFDGDDTFAEGDTIYVTLEEREGAWHPTAMAHARPGAGTFLKGRVTDVGSIACAGDDTCTSYDVEYGIEQFFVPEGVGKELENERNALKLGVDVAVSGEGRVALKRLIVDGEPRYEERLY